MKKQKYLFLLEGQVQYDWDRVDEKALNERQPPDKPNMDSDFNDYGAENKMLIITTPKYEKTLDSYIKEKQVILQIHVTHSWKETI